MAGCVLSGRTTKSPNLADPILDGLGLGVRVTLGHDAGQLGSRFEFSDIHIQIVPRHINAVFLNELLFVFAVRTGADKPDCHVFSFHELPRFAGISSSRS
jgi:hypothetical protein